MQTKLPRPARWPSWSAISAMDPDLDQWVWVKIWLKFWTVLFVNFSMSLSVQCSQGFTVDLPTLCLFAMFKVESKELKLELEKKSWLKTFENPKKLTENSKTWPVSVRGRIMSDTAHYWQHRWGSLLHKPVTSDICTSTKIIFETGLAIPNLLTKLERLFGPASWQSPYPYGTNNWFSQE